MGREKPEESKYEYFKGLLISTLNILAFTL